MNAANTLRVRLQRPGLITAPGIYDMISARIAERMGFPALYPFTEFAKLMDFEQVWEFERRHAD